MTGRFSAQVLDDLLAPGISAFSSAEVPELPARPEAEHWIANLFLTSLFHVGYNEAWKQAAVTLMVRAGHAMRSYQQARADTLACVAEFRPGRPAIRLYFKAVSEWETVLLNVQICIDVFREVIDRDVEIPDESGRLIAVVNRIKHFGEDIAGRLNGPDLTIPVWLTSTGLQSRKAAVTFAEVAEHVEEMAKMCDVLQHPSRAG